MKENKKTLYQDNSMDVIVFVLFPKLRSNGFVIIVYRIVLVRRVKNTLFTGLQCKHAGVSKSNVNFQAALYTKA